MGKKVVNAKKKAKFEAQQYVEDLDLDVEDGGSSSDEESQIVHNKRQKAPRSKHASAVLPSDAHLLDGYGDDEYGFAEEHELAEKAAKAMKQVMEEEDYAIPGLAVGETAKKKKNALLPEVRMEAPVIETIERDFAALSTGERFAILQKESPELLKMLEDLKKYLAEVKRLAQPLHSLLHERKLTSEADQNLLSFLETKVQLMLSYCMHVTFYLLLKSEGKSVAEHPVIDTLVEIRVYLEKMWPLEEKLQYSLNRLLSGKSMAAVAVDRLRPVQGAESGVAFATPRSAQNSEARERRHLQRSLKEAEDLEKEELSAMTRVRTKKATQLNALSPSGAVSMAPLAYREEEDQYFSRLTGGGGGPEDEEDGDDEEGLSLMETLRRRQAAVEQHRNGKKNAANSSKAGASHSVGEDEESDGEDEEYDGEDEEDFLEDEEVDDVDGGEEETEDDYDALVAEEKERVHERGEKKSAETAARGKFEVAEVDRRKAGKRIEAHRGLTKARPKDRKNPRVAQRRKYERGMRVHKSQTRTHQPEADGGFAGVRSIKPGVVRSRTLS